jgi:putative ABC transport system permease protein
MRDELRLIWRQMTGQPVHTVISLLVLTLTFSLPITVLALGEALRQGIITASDPFGLLVVGAKGSSQQLVLNSVLLQDEPVGNIPLSIYEGLQNDPRVQLAIPLAIGDNVGGAPIIGTSEAFFQLRASQREPLAFQLREGRFFLADFEAVLGSRAARALGLRVGDRFQSQHGFRQGLPSDIHQEVYTVVGILAPSQTAYDAAVYVTLNSVWSVHAETEAVLNYGASLTTGETPARSDDVTAILLKPTGFIEMNQLWQEFYARPDAQAAFPGQELGELFELIEQAQALLNAVSYLVLAIAALTVFLSIYSTTLNRQQSLAVMRSLGSRPRRIFRMVMLESILLTLLGGLLARPLGYGVAAFIGQQVASTAAIPIRIVFLPDLEPWLWAVSLSLGGVAGLLPALWVYRLDPVEKLFPT